jgi:hypothetical protein
MRIPDNRPKQTVPADLVNQLMILVRTQFCGNMDAKEWGKHSHFVRRNVIMWPARFICDKKGFTIPGERYDQIMRLIFLEIRRNMTNAPIRYWPGYLMRCVQEHWHHHWEDYYTESKASTNLTQSTLIALGRLPDPSDSTIASIAAAHSVLSSKAKRKAIAAPKQMGLF